LATKEKYERRLRALLSLTAVLIVVLLAGGGVIIRNQSAAAEAQRMADQRKLQEMMAQQEILIRQLHELQDSVPCIGRGDGGCPSTDERPGDYVLPSRQLQKGGSETEPIPGLPSPRRPPPWR
jgi:hypothetical protein